MLKERSNRTERSATKSRDEERDGGKKLTEMINVQCANTRRIGADIVCHVFVLHLCNLCGYKKCNKTMWYLMKRKIIIIIMKKRREKSVLKIQWNEEK